MSKASARNTEDSSPENSLDDYKISKRVLICFDNVAFFMSRHNIALFRKYRGVIIINFQLGYSKEEALRKTSALIYETKGKDARFAKEKRYS